MGSSGSGKSTLLHLMGGVDRPTSGTVFLNSNDVYALSLIHISLAQSLVSAQGGTLRASNAPEGGARFDMTFPKMNV